MLTLLIFLLLRFKTHNTLVVRNMIFCANFLYFHSFYTDTNYNWFRAEVDAEG